MVANRDIQNGGEGWDAAAQMSRDAAASDRNGGGKSSAPAQHDGDADLGSADAYEDELGLPGEEIDETSAGGLRYPHDPSELREAAAKR